MAWTAWGKYCGPTPSTGMVWWRNRSSRKRKIKGRKKPWEKTEAMNLAQENPHEFLGPSFGRYRLYFKGLISRVWIQTDQVLSHSCCMACLAVGRSSGSHFNIDLMKSMNRACSLPSRFSSCCQKWGAESGDRPLTSPTFSDGVSGPSITHIEKDLTILVKVYWWMLWASKEFLRCRA